MDMTTVLPLPVAILHATRNSVVPAAAQASLQVVEDPVVARLLRDLGEVDERFERLDLAEEQPALAVLPRPVFEQTAGDRRDVRDSPDRARARPGCG